MFTYPFCYTPSKEISDASGRLIRKIDGDPSLKGLFGEGKMLGVMMVRMPDGSKDFIYGFSGNAGGRSIIEGFVPPIFDLSDPDGWYKKREAEISRTDDAGIKAEMSRELQDWIFTRYIVRNALGEEKSIKDIFASQGLVPPGGTGECAAPKMLQFAYRNGMEPLAMGEFWYGRSPSSEVRLHGHFYPSCTGKCGPLLGFMLQGLEVEPSPLSNHDGMDGYSIVYEDGCILVIDKPSGMICVPGKTGEDSLLEKLEKERKMKIYSCHRLDMDTSGLIVYAKTPGAKVDLERQFSDRSTEKTYMARLSSGAGFTLPEKGVIELPLMPDYYDRPRQKVDYDEGKAAVTEYRVMRVLENGEMDIQFRPHTGRTHQLRVHAAHAEGLGRPIKGDRLYGGTPFRRLCLHAAELSFDHPETGERMHFGNSTDYSIFD